MLRMVLSTDCCPVEVKWRWWWWPVLSTVVPMSREVVPLMVHQCCGQWSGWSGKAPRQPTRLMHSRETKMHCATDTAVHSLTVLERRWRQWHTLCPLHWVTERRVYITRHSFTSLNTSPAVYRDEAKWTIRVHWCLYGKLQASSLPVEVRATLTVVIIETATNYCCW